MPTHKQATVNSPTTEKKLGNSGSETLKSIFSESPIYKEELTDESIRKNYQETVLDGVTNDQGHTFGEQNMDYEDSPEYSDVESGGEGKPGSPWVPNPRSPGPGSTNPGDQMDPPDNFGTKPNDTPFVGDGSQLSPKKSSEKLSAHTLGDYGFGKSSK